MTGDGATTHGSRGKLASWLGHFVEECGIAHCRRFHVSHRLLSRIRGVFLGRVWFCSPLCLRDAVDQKVRAERESALAGLRRKPRMPWRLLLVAQGTVTEEQLEQARLRQLRAEGGPVEDLGDTLERLGYATADQVAGARATEAGCGFYVGDGEPIPPTCNLPLSLVERHGVVPVHFASASGRLLIGFTYRFDYGLQHAIEEVTGFQTEACMITQAVYRQQLQRLRGLGLATIEHDGSAVHASPAGVAELVVSHALRSGADHVRMAITRDAIWLRLSSAQSSRDLVVDLEEEEMPTVRSEPVRAGSAHGATGVAAAR